jgi:acetyltransferase-like isoleucine patch superfamily enzyme
MLSADFIYPLNTSPIGPNAMYGAIGAHINISDHVSLWAGFATAQTYGWGIPLGFTFTVGDHIEFYTGTNDISAFVRPSNADVSLAVWAFRYNL